MFVFPIQKKSKVKNLSNQVEMKTSAVRKHKLKLNWIESNLLRPLAKFDLDQQIYNIIPYTCESIANSEDLYVNID